MRPIALAVAAFARAPADLPDGSRLYPQQVRAAVSLAGRALIQMNTGEGKTYALLPAAFALACRYQKVYILCANDYLAWRDATRTRRFWDFIGVHVGLCLETGTAETEWSAPVIYTTLAAMIFKSMWDDIAPVLPEIPLTRGALILDEADAILLDQADQTFVISFPIKGEAYDWRFALDFARDLIEDEHILVDRSTFSAALTVQGEVKLLEALTEVNDSKTAFLLHRFTVEVSFLALFVAEQDVHYVVEDGRLYAVDPVTSQIQRGKTPSWLIPLEYARGMPARPRLVVLHETSPRVFLNGFAHLSGLSGSVEDDSFEYLLSYLLPTLHIDPIRPRHDGLQEDRVFMKPQAAIKALTEEVREAVEAGRPVLVGTQSIADAENAHNALQQQFDDSVKLHLFTGRDDQAAADLFQKAGEASTVLVATQLAGRGVDIRLSPEARRNGGLALFSLGHALEMRHDKQFLGRAGRQGDPFTARFICSIYDRLFKEFGSERIETILQRLNVDENEAIEHPWVSKSVARAQRKRRSIRLKTHQMQEYLSWAESDAHDSFVGWFDHLRLQDDTGSEDEVSPSFIRHVIRRFSQEMLVPVLRHDEVTGEEAEIVCRIIEEALGVSTDALSLSPYHLATLPPNAVIDRSSKVLMDAVQAAQHNRRRQLDDLDEALQPLDVTYWTLSRIIERLDHYIEHAGGATVYDTDGSILLSASFNEESKGEPPDTQSTKLIGIGQNTDGTRRSFDLSTIFDDLESCFAEPTDITTLDDALRHLDEALYSPPPAPEVWTAAAPRFNKLREVALQYQTDLFYRMQQARTRRNRFIDRSPRQAAVWRLKLTRSIYLEDRDRARHRIFQKDYSLLDQYRLVRDRLAELWVSNEQQLPGRLLHDLVHVDRPRDLDELFFLADNLTSMPDSRQRTVYVWSPSVTIQDPPKTTTSRDEMHVQRFVETSASELSASHFGETHLRRLLFDFVVEAPLNMLSTPERIQDALERWFRLEAERGVDTRRRKLHQAWLQQFLLHLRSRNVIGPLPTLRTRLRSGFSQFGRTLRETRTILSALSMLVFLAFFLLGVAFGGFADTKTFGLFGRYVDALLFGNLLQAGNIMAACFALPILMYMLADVLNQRRPIFLLSEIPLLFQAFFAWWLTDWTGNGLSLPGIVRGAAVAVLVFIVLDVTRKVISGLHLKTNIDLTAGWLCYTIPFLFIPALAADASALLWVAGTSAVLVTVAIGWHYFNVFEVTLVSVHVTGASTSDLEGEEIATGVGVRGSTGTRPHFFGLLFAWLSYRVLEMVFGETSLVVLSAVPAVVYWLILGLWAQTILNKRFSIHLWQDRLNKNRQRLSDAPTYEDTRWALKRVRTTLKRREFIFQTLLLAAMTALLYGETVPGTRFPLALVVLFGSFLLGYALRTFCVHLFKFLVNRVPGGVEELDLSVFEEKDAQASTLHRLRLLFQNRITKILGTILLLAEIIFQILDALDLLKRTIP